LEVIGIAFLSLMHEMRKKTQVTTHWHTSPPTTIPNIFHCTLCSLQIL